jgi:hypothetical protein
MIVLVVSGKDIYKKIPYALIIIFLDFWCARQLLRARLSLCCRPLLLACNPCCAIITDFIIVVFRRFCKLWLCFPLFVSFSVLLFCNSFQQLIFVVCCKIGRNCCCLCYNNWNYVRFEVVLVHVFVLLFLCIGVGHIMQSQPY